MKTKGKLNFIAFVMVLISFLIPVTGIAQLNAKLPFARLVF